jgi:hypothetical protein
MPCTLDMFILIVMLTLLLSINDASCVSRAASSATAAMAMELGVAWPPENVICARSRKRSRSKCGLRMRSGVYGVASR